MKLDILFEDDHMLACVKPVGVPSQSDKTNDEDMVTIVKNYIFENSDSNEEPYVAMLHRLDRPVGGVMIFAKNKEAAAKLSKQQTDGTMIKYYQAVLTGELPEEYGELSDYMVKDKKTNISKICDKSVEGAKKAELTYELLDEFETDEGVLSYVLIELLTGRHHQIRVQMANLGCGVWGDTKYNPKFKNVKKGIKQIALFSSRIELEHPVTNEHMVFKKEPYGKAFDIIELDEF
ncbi:MAG: RluA family pseudouridine synthase [Lachnospiraceae bacterium]|nr:RluA family pseudouridine synthase [Lachnospiraceae bacterium]